MKSPCVLVVDDESDLCELLEITFIKMGLDVESAQSLASARAALARRDFSLVLTDMRLPDGLGIDLVREVAAAARGTPIAVLTAFGSAENAVAALKAGAFDYLAKPVRLDQLRKLVSAAVRTASFAAPQQPEGSMLRLLGESEAMRSVQAQIRRLARSMAPVAITGESGTGKELAARDVHALSVRAEAPFVAVNCGAIPENLMEAEFFGYRKGSFTGATEDREGFFQAAHGGTLMLDEVADLPLAMQVKLLRAIQERRVRRIGATQEEPVDVRIISATHQDLAACVEQGRFRQDLYYRLNVIELRLPPLRERREDLPLLAAAVLRRLAGGEVPPSLSPDALRALQLHAFPGNVRELENVLERALAFAAEGQIEPRDLGLRTQLETASPSPARPLTPSQAEVTPFPVPPQPLQSTGPSATQAPAGFARDDGAPLPKSLTDHLDQVEREVILKALARSRFNRTQAAELLGISLRQLRYRMQRLSIHEPE